MEFTPKAKFCDQVLCLFNLSDDMSHDEGPVPGGADSGDHVAGEAVLHMLRMQGKVRG